jgi:GTPase SAR1 family protein
MAEGDHPLLLITGMPGVGKSCLVHHACAEWNGQPVILEELPAHDVFHKEWQRGLRAGSAATFVRTLRNQPRMPIVEWGFPPNDMCIAFVRSARESGMRVVWIECPDDEARRRYLKRGTHPIELFEIQVPLIRTNYERIMAEVQPEVSTF